MRQQFYSHFFLVFRTELFWIIYHLMFNYMNFHFQYILYSTILFWRCSRYLKTWWLVKSSWIMTMKSMAWCYFHFLSNNEVSFISRLDFEANNLNRFFLMKFVVEVLIRTELFVFCFNFFIGNSFCCYFSPYIEMGHIEVRKTWQESKSHSIWEVGYKRTGEQYYMFTISA